MTEYALGAFAILAISCLLSLVCYGSGTAEKTAVGIIAAFIIISPLVTAVRDIDIDSALDSITGGGYESEVSPSPVAEDAFAEGIKRAVADKFSVDKENIRVKIIDFDMKNMSCGQIVIFLRGTGVFADYRGIESYINSLGMGECRVEVELGKGDS